jgi:hypothetical protein
MVREKQNHMTDGIEANLRTPFLRAAKRFCLRILMLLDFPEKGEFKVEVQPRMLANYQERSNEVATR